MRQKVAKALRRQCNRMGITPSGYRKIKKKYNNLRPYKTEDIRLPNKLEIIKGKWISIKRQKRALWQDSSKCLAS